MITADVVSERNRYHHDPEKLASAIMRLYAGRNQVEAPDPVAAGLPGPMAPDALEDVNGIATNGNGSNGANGSTNGATAGASRQTPDPVD